MDGRKQEGRPSTTPTQKPTGPVHEPVGAKDRCKQPQRDTPRPTLVGMPALAARSSPATAALLEMTRTMWAALLGSRVLSISACRFEPEEKQQAHTS